MTIEILAVTIRPCSGAFIRVPSVVHKHDDAWIPPLMMEREEAFSPKDNEFLGGQKCASGSPDATAAISEESARKSIPWPSTTTQSASVTSAASAPRMTPKPSLRL